MARRRITKVRRHTFKGKEYYIKWGKIPTEERGRGKNKGVYIVYGECDPPTVSDRELKINDKEGDTKKKCDYETFASAFHEGCHATNWKLSEKTIQDLEENVAPFLWKIFIQ